MASLHARGWRQGSIFRADLPVDVVVLGDDDRPQRRSDVHSRWAVVTQDCDLDGTSEEETEATIELRPVYTEDAPEDWGIRSSRFLLRDGDYLVSNSPRLTVSGNLLSALLNVGGADRQDPPAERNLALKTWLGLRYDRPAVPASLVPLAKRISEEVRHRRFREIARRTRDVLMQFDDSVAPHRFSLYAVLEREEDAEEVRAWLADAALAVPATLGVAAEIQAAPATRISLHLIETSYSADVSQLTWRANAPEQDGAA
ncbi:MAG: hypothetical protein ACKVUT_09895 [Gaiella sp.]